MLVHTAWCWTNSDSSQTLERERLKRSQSFQETIIITRSLPQDEHMPAEWTLSESVMWALSVLWKPTCQCTVGTDAFRLDTRHVANTRIHTQDALVHTSLHIHNMSHIPLSWTPNKAVLWQQNMRWMPNTSLIQAHQGFFDEIAGGKICKHTHIISDCPQKTDFILLCDCL